MINKIIICNKNFLMYISESKKEEINKQLKRL